MKAEEAANAFSLTRLGQVAQMAQDEAAMSGNDKLALVADICLRRGNDPDPDITELITAVLCGYANSRGVAVAALPNATSH